ncbi:DNA-dependent RNA polymerase II [Marasmius sp. AFHP31]|nr:DNA-dependent RNA polymerase II [Marasmius sp. AFHP31]
MGDSGMNIELWDTEKQTALASLRDSALSTDSITQPVTSIPTIYPQPLCQHSPIPITTFNLASSASPLHSNPHPVSELTSNRLGMRLSRYWARPTKPSATAHNPSLLHSQRESFLFSSNLSWDADKTRINEDLWPHEVSGYYIGLLPSLDMQAETTSAEAKRVRAPIYKTRHSGGTSSGLEGLGEEYCRCASARRGFWENMKSSERTRTLKSTSWIHTSRLPACGPVKNLALLSCIFVKSYFAPVIEWMSGVGLESLEEDAHSPTPCTKVFANAIPAPQEAYTMDSTDTTMREELVKGGIAELLDTGRRQS